MNIRFCHFFLFYPLHFLIFKFPPTQTHTHITSFLWSISFLFLWPILIFMCLIHLHKIIKTKNVTTTLLLLVCTYITHVTHTHTHTNNKHYPTDSSISNQIMKKPEKSENKSQWPFFIFSFWFQDFHSWNLYSIF